MSHEIRTPLTGIIGYSGLALEEKQMSDEMRHYLKLVHSASNSLRTVINDILDLAKIETGKVDVATTPFSIRELVDNCASLAEPDRQGEGPRAAQAVRSGDSTMVDWRRGSRPADHAQSDQQCD